MKNSETLTAASEPKARKGPVFTKFRAAATAVVFALATLCGIFVWRCAARASCRIWAIRSTSSWRGSRS